MNQLFQVQPFRRIYQIVVLLTFILISSCGGGGQDNVPAGGSGLSSSASSSSSRTSSAQSASAASSASSSQSSSSLSSNTSSSKQSSASSLSSSSSASTQSAASSAMPASFPNNIQRYGHAYSVPHDFTADQYTYIAQNYPIFTVEKRHAYVDYGGNPSSEAATIGTAAKIKAINSKTKVLLYWNSILNYQLYESQATLPTDHPEWIAGIHAGTRLEMYDLNNSDLQTWWINSAASIVNRGNLDGVFLDAIPKVPDSMQASLLSMIDALRAKIGMDKVVIYNGFRVANPKNIYGGSNYLDHASGVFVEAFLSDPVDTKEDAAALLDMLIAAQKTGKTIVVRGSPSTTWGTTQTDMKFDVAAFLLFYGANSYFEYNWGYGSDSGLLVDFPEYALSIGQPLGDAVRSGWVYTREFEHASVRIDFEHVTASITSK